MYFIGSFRVLIVGVLKADSRSEDGLIVDIEIGIAVITRLERRRQVLQWWPRVISHLRECFRLKRGEKRGMKRGE